MGKLVAAINRGFAAVAGDMVMHAVSDTDPAIIGAILLPGVTLATWQRRLPDRIMRWLDRLDYDTIDDVEQTCVATPATDSIFKTLSAAGYPVGPDARWFAGEIAGLVHRYAGIVDAREVTFRLEVIETDACRRFHADFVSVRAITTYLGPGTQWLSPADAAALAPGAEADDRAVQQIATGSFALMKGRLWAADMPLVHRSPPIMASGGRRLVLVLDPVGDAGDRP